jgi:hypothetical protein
LRIYGKSKSELHFVKFCKTFNGLFLAIETDTIFYLKNNANNNDFVCKIESNFFLDFCQFRVKTGFILKGTVSANIY